MKRRWQWYETLMHRYWHPTREIPEGWADMLRRAGWRPFIFERIGR